jgi:hypothetical protein
MTILAPATETLVRCLACRDGGQRVPHRIEGRSWQKNYVAVCGASRLAERIVHRTPAARALLHAPGYVSGSVQ